MNVSSIMDEYITCRCSLHNPTYDGVKVSGFLI